MAERRTCQVYSSIEPSLDKLVSEVVGQDYVSVSVYLRRLIIADLTARGKLSTEELLQIVA